VLISFDRAGLPAITQGSRRKPGASFSSELALWRSKFEFFSGETSLAGRVSSPARGTTDFLTVARGEIKKPWLGTLRTVPFQRGLNSDDCASPNP